MCDLLRSQGKATPIVLASSIQAVLENPYGVSKRQAEAVLADYAAASGAPVLIYRLPNVFGKWCRPNYNSVVATFCHNIARDLPITLNDPDRVLELVHIDDVVAAFGAELGAAAQPGVAYRSVAPVLQVTVGALAAQAHAFRQLRQTLRLPDMADLFTRKPYGVYLTCLDEGDFAYAMDKKCDPRGCLAEFIKGPSFGQVFISRTVPGIARGNHYHDTKTEKFLVVKGEAMIRFRHALRGDVLEYRASGQDFRVVDIPPATPTRLRTSDRVNW